MPNESARGLLNTTYGLITQNKALINTFSQKSGRTLFQAILLLQRPDLDMPLITLMVTHPLFDPRNTNKNKEGLTNIQAMITYRRLDVLRVMAADPRILYIGQSFSYEYVKKQYDIACAQLMQERTMLSQQIDQAQQIAKQLGNILVFFVKITIEYAIKNDDATLFDKLACAGFRPSQLTIRGKLPFSHLTTKNTELHAWFKREQAKTNSAAGANPYSFHASAATLVPSKALVNVKDQGLANEKMKSAFEKVP